MELSHIVDAETHGTNQIVIFTLQDTEAKIFHTVSLVFSIVPQFQTKINNSCSIAHMITKELPVGKLVSIAALNDHKVV